MENPQSNPTKTKDKNKTLILSLLLMLLVLSIVFVVYPKSVAYLELKEQAKKHPKVIKLFKDEYGCKQAEIIAIRQTDITRYRMDGCGNSILIEADNIEEAKEGNAIYFLEQFRCPPSKTVTVKLLEITVKGCPGKGSYSDERSYHYDGHHYHAIGTGPNHGVIF